MEGIREVGLGTAVEELARLRGELAEAQGEVKKLKEEFENRVDVKVAKGRVAMRLPPVVDMEETVRQMAVASFWETKDKHPHLAVEVKEVEEVEVLDKEGLRAWCVRNFVPALQLDMEVIKRSMKFGGFTLPAEYASVKKVPKAYIAQDLSGFVGESWKPNPLDEKGELK